MLSALLNREIEFESKIETTGSFGNDKSNWAFHKKRKASVSVQPVSSYSENTGEIVNYVTTFILRYDKNINYSHRIKYNGSFYKIRTIQELGRKEGLIIKSELIEGNNYGQ